jgi:tetratricopeptide (TPR) repeat protein
MPMPNSKPTEPPAAPGSETAREGRKPTPNALLRQARRRLLSPSGSGRPMSRQELAEAINTYLWNTHGIDEHLDETDIGKLERGEHRWPRVRRREAFRAVLRVDTDAAIGFYIIRAAVATTASTLEPSCAYDLEVIGEVLRQPSEGRRALLRSIAMVAAASGLLGGPGRARTHRLGSTDVVRLNAVTTLYRSMDYEFGGGMLVEDVNGFAESASALLDLSYPDSLAPSLLAAIAAARQLAGWTSFDSGRHCDAQRHFQSAERAAVAAGDVLLAARVRYCQARQLQHLRHNRDALETLRLARDQLGTAATPAVSAMIYGAEAASRAALGDRDSALNALGRAHDEYDGVNADHEPEWMRFYDQGELLAQYGRVYRDLARVDPRHGRHAVRWVTDAINAFGPQNVRSTVLNEVGLCSALFLADEPEQALTVGARVRDQATRLTSRRIVDRIANLRRDLERHQRLPGVAEFARSLPTLGADTA